MARQARGGHGVRLIATDLDGTLLAPDGTIPAENVSAIRDAHADGIAFVVATGRPIRWLECLDPIADLHPYVVASNGAAIYDLAEARVLRSHTFGSADVATLAGLIRDAVPHVCFGLERGDLFGIEPASPSDHARFPGVLHLPLPELVEVVTPVVKLIAYSTEIGCDELSHLVTPAVGPLATVTSSLTHSDFGMVELSVPGVTKASALDELCGQLGLSASEAVAFGDMPNDLDMLTWAGRGFAMADAHPRLLARFEVVGACGDAGVGRAIRRLLAQ